jgi:hypothetical protein
MWNIILLFAPTLMCRPTVDGLRYNEKSTVKSVHIRVIDKLDDSDVYDFILAAVRYDQMESALMSLRENQSPIGFAVSVFRALAQTFRIGL